MRCAACRRTITNPVSLKHGLGPDCLKKAVRAGSAPLEHLEELAAWARSKKRKARPDPQSAAPVRDDRTLDLFAEQKQEAINRLNQCADECRRHGLSVTIEIQE